MSVREGLDHGQQAKLTSRAALASVATAAFLLLLKAFAAYQTGSVAMLGSLADTALDLVASMVTLYGVRLAALPADDDHRFGHGKAEALVALFQVALIAVSATAILYRAISTLNSDQATADAEFGIGVSIASILVTLLLLTYQRRVIRRTGSLAIGADNVHYQSDLLLNGAVIAALVLDQYVHLGNADPIFGILIALWIGWGAFNASVHAIDQLMDKEWPDEKRRRFAEVADCHPKMNRIHDLRTRTAGNRDFAQFHAWVDADMSIADAHDIMDYVEARLDKEFPGTEVLIHLDPAGQIDRAGHHDERLRETPER